MRLPFLFAVCAAFGVSSGAAKADTVLDFNDDFGGDLYVQDGFELSSGGFPFFFGGSSPYLEIGIFATPQPGFYELERTDGAAFSLVSFFLAPGTSGYVFPSPQDDLQLTGYLDGSMVASLALSSQGGAATHSTFYGFGEIDRLELRSIYTQNAMDEFNDGGGGDVFLRLDNLTLGETVSVPLPPALAGLGGALALLAVGAYRRRA